MVKQDYAQMFITGPVVVKATTGEDVSAVELGGAMTHNQKSGVSHFMADTDEDCINQIKILLSYLPANHNEKPPVIKCDDPAGRMEEKLNTIVPESSNRPYDMKKLIKMVVDNGEIYESQKALCPEYDHLFCTNEWFFCWNHSKSAAILGGLYRYRCI